jgi:hypothetical protein
MITFVLELLRTYVMEVPDSDEITVILLCMNYLSGLPMTAEVFSNNIV